MRDSDRAFIKWLLIGIVVTVAVVVAFLIIDAWYAQWKMIQRGQEVSLEGAPSISALQA